MRLGSGSGEPNGDSPGLSKLADFADDTEFLCLVRVDDRGRFASDCVNNVRGNIWCSALNDALGNLNIVSKTLRRLFYATQCLPFAKPPVVFVKEKSCMFGTGAFIGGQKEG